MKKKLVAVLALSLAVTSCLAGCGGKTDKDSQAGSQQAGADVDLSGTYDITVWISESDGVAALTEEQIKKFNEANKADGIVVNATVEGISEADSATKMIADVASGADIFCFAQDQLLRLVEAGALNKLGTKAAESVLASHDEIAGKAASVGKDVYCYPLTSDNGYFMYYDKTVVKEEHLGSLEDIIADCEAAGRGFSMETETSAWYLASFFFATGCHSDWTTDAQGKATGVDDTFNSAEGLIAMKGMEKLVKSPIYVSSSKGADFAAAVPSAVVVSGTWESATVQEALGDNMGVAALPSFTVDGNTYHMGSYGGCKLMGVKPQEDAKRTAVLQRLALYLTNAECSLERFQLKGWGPSNLEAQKDSAVQSSPLLQALQAQAPYAVPQGAIHGSWWDIAKLLGTNAKEATSEADLQAGLDAYTASLDALFSKSEDELNAFSLIGSFGGYNWDTDVAMTKEGDDTWTAEVELKAGDQFKTRQGGSWDVNFGFAAVTNCDADAFETNDDGNIVVKKDGTYAIKLVFDGTNATIEITAK